MRTQVDGVIEPSASDFVEAAFSRVFNRRRPDRAPAAVLRATSVDDVVRGVQLARERGWQVSVRSGGHSWAVWSVRDEALLIDLAELDSMTYDASTGIVVAGPAVRGGADLDPFLAAHGRFFNGGHCPTVGIGGFLLQGGMGWNCRGWGWAAESVAAVDVVTADGQVLRCDDEQNTDLYWAARGAGPGFPGIVVAFHIRTRERPARLTQTTLVFPGDLAPDVLAWFDKARWDVPDSVELVAVGIHAPLPPGVEHDGSVLVVDGVCFETSATDAADALEPLAACPLREHALAVRDAEVTTMDALRAEQVRANPEGHRYVVDNAYLDGPRDALITALAPAFSTLPTAKSFSLWFDMGRERPLPDMALSVQSDLYYAAYVVCEDPSDDELCRDWLEEQMTALEPYSIGCYLGDSDFTRRPQRFLSDENYARFKRIRAARDPEGLFPSYLVAEGATLNANPREQP